jgi:uncharacterized protein YndB with AHSA1/START domain
MEQARVSEKPALSLQRHYPVAPEKVWRAWTDPQALKRWWGPGGPEAVSLVQLDVRVGGRFRVLMVDAQGEEFDVSGTYREVVSARKLVMTFGWKSQPGHESLVTVNIRPLNGGTHLELRHDQYVDFENQPTHEQGWNGAFDTLELLTKEQS